MSDTHALPQEDQLVTIATFPMPLESDMARMALEAAGIPVFIRSENANRIIPVFAESNLQVRREDEAAARAVLAEAISAPATEQEVAAAELAAESGQ